MKDKGKSQNHGGDSSVPRGYKKTEVGVIPEDWSLVPLGRLISSVEYGSSAKSNAQGQTPVLRMGNLQNGKIDWNDLVYTSDVAEIRKYTLKSGDVLFNRTNTIDLVGKTSIYKGEQPAIFAGYLIRISVDKSLLDSKFLNYILNTEFSKRHSAKVLSVAVGQANINSQKLKTYPVPLPSTKAEQETIAGALSDVDALIESLEQLIAKKHHIKQGAMQELLTGKKRLPGFQVKPGYKKTEVGVIPEDWDTPELGEILKSMQLGGNYKNTESENSWPLIKMGNLGRGSIKLDKLEFIDSSQAPASRDRLYADDLLFNTRNTLDLVGKIAVWRNELPEAYFNSNIARMKFKEECVSSYRFMNYIMNTPRTLKGLRSIAIGTTSVAAIYGRDLVKLKVSLPTKAEQEAIATILSDMDAEITALETKLAKTRAIKQGMMHNLLTGKIRLVKPEKSKLDIEA